MEAKNGEDTPSSRAPAKAEAEDGAVSGHTCGVCSRSFPLLSSLSQHMRRHTREKPYKCPHCEHRTAQKGSLKAHIRGHKLGLFQQNLCTSEAQMSEEPGKIPEAPEAPEAAAPAAPEAERSSPAVNGKVRRKGTKRKASDADAAESGAEADAGGHCCVICGQAFPQMLLLKSHMKVHNGPEDYGCRICGRRFRQAWFYQSHVHSHRSKAARKCNKAADPPATINGVPQDPLSLVNEVCCYQLCGVCGNFFHDRAALQVHEQLHKPRSADPLQDATPVPDPEAKRLFMEGLKLASVEPSKTPREWSLGRQIPQLDPVVSYQTLKLATTGRLAAVLPSKKGVTQDNKKAKRVPPRQGKKRKQATASSSQNKKLKAEPVPEQRSKSPTPAKSSTKKSHITLNGLGQAFYEELHSKKPKDVSPGNAESVFPGVIKVYFCQHCDFSTGSTSNLRSHLYTQHPDILDPLRSYAKVLNSLSQSGVKAFSDADGSQIQSGQFNAESAFNLSLLKANKGDPVAETDGIISHECPFCVHVSLYPEVLWMHQQIEHKVSAGCPMAPRWAVSSSSLRSLRAGALQWRRTGPPPFLKGKDCPPLTPQKSQRTKPQDAPMQHGCSSSSSSSSKLSGVSKSKPQRKDSRSSNRKTGSTPPKKARVEGAVEHGSTTSGVQTSSLSSTTFNNNTPDCRPSKGPRRRSRAATTADSATADAAATDSAAADTAATDAATADSATADATTAVTAATDAATADAATADADAATADSATADADAATADSATADATTADATANAAFPQEGLGLMLARPPSQASQPRRHPAEPSSDLKGLDLWAALNVLAQKAYAEPSGPVHVAPGKGESAGEKPGEVDILGLLRGYGPHDLASLCQQWGFVDPKVDPKALLQFNGNLAIVHPSPESSLVNGCCTPPPGSLQKGP